VKYPRNLFHSSIPTKEYFSTKVIKSMYIFAKYYIYKILKIEELILLIGGSLKKNQKLKWFLASIIGK
jgi:hypothetical protein